MFMLFLFWFSLRLFCCCCSKNLYMSISNDYNFRFIFCRGVFKILSNINNGIYWLLKFVKPLSANLQKGQTHSNNSSANCWRIVWVCLTILWGWRLKIFQDTGFLWPIFSCIRTELKIRSCSHYESYKKNWMSWSSVVFWKYGLTCRIL